MSAPRPLARPAPTARGRRRVRRAAGAACVALAATGCALLRIPRLPPRLADCPAPLASTASLPPGDFRLRDQARFVGRSVDAGFDLVVEKHGRRVVVVGLDPFGTRAFSVVQEGTDVEARSFLGPALAVPPENVLRDLHAARFADPHAPARVTVERPECGYTATFVTVERSGLP
jgi:hypothetical protein